MTQYNLLLLTVWFGFLQTQLLADDTLQIVKNELNGYNFKLNKDSSDNKYPSLIIIDNNGERIGFLYSVWEYSVDSNTIVIPLNLSINWFNQNFYIENFPSTKSSLNFSQHNNRIELGEITGNLSENGKIVYDFSMVDSSLMENVSFENIRESYTLIEVEKTPFDVQCESRTWQEWYTLFYQITWATLLYDTFTLEEYNQIERMFLVCLGPEHGEDFLEYRNLIMLIKN